MESSLIDDPAGRSPFDAVVFAGGGSRCFWQLGFWSVAAPALGIAPREIAAVSAGSAMACAVFAGRIERAMRLFLRATGSNPRNVYPGRILSRRPCFPHYEMYRETILEALDGQALDRLHAGPEVQILLARPPRWIGPGGGLLLGLACYVVEKRLRDPVHARAGAAAGFTPQVVSTRRCATAEQLADLILASSCTPPFTPLLRHDGRSVVDGGLIDSAPVRALTRSYDRCLVLCSRRYSRPPPADPARLYVGPSVDPPVSKWDYTDPAALQATFDLGRRDADRFVLERRAPRA